MASEIRRAAKALVATRVETFDVPSSTEDARERIERALAGLGPPRALRYSGAWSPAAGGRASYVATFLPSPRTPMLLNAISVAITLLIVASAWAVLSAGEEAAARFLLPMLTVLAIISLPFAIAGFAARREAEESRILRAIRAELADAS